ncbi:hypothetical protein PN462_15365 [Spirulina sp. CS-785/01]|uniref:tetratricopeptide repeat protein n=1 Tax=Spirulina sp. CS-785/01 TaxID=3021716 RepID=UPI00232DD3B8|nr:hypothetical protein [Spirulina sp. CS-785/01]MDB9314490.1 hypothetical protein [Spirulina sp. CS-785/01]
MSESVASLYESGLERYQAGESPETLIPVFKEICDRARKNAAAWSSLAWLYLLADKPNQALRAAQKSVKMDKKAPQVRINLALAMLETGQKGVRTHIEAAQEMMALSSEIRQDIEENIADGLNRKPDWEALHRVKQWLDLE